VNRRHKLPTYLLPRSPHGAAVQHQATLLCNIARNTCNIFMTWPWPLAAAHHLFTIRSWWTSCDCISINQRSMMSMVVWQLTVVQQKWVVRPCNGHIGAWTQCFCLLDHVTQLFCGWHQLYKICAVFLFLLDGWLLSTQTTSASWHDAAIFIAFVNKAMMVIFWHSLHYK